MRVGVTFFLQNYRDWERFAAKDTQSGPAVSDAQIYQDELKLGELVEPLGFDAMWTVEHHYSPYTMIPDPLQFLSYHAGRTERIDFGTMVIVLPWHDPLQVAEEIAMFDNMIGGRRLRLGFGRGAARREFEALRIPMEESRERFDEALAVVRLALSQERFAYEGAFYQIPETTIRPQPRTKDLLDEMYIAWGSPATLPIGANAGLGILMVNQKSVDEYHDDVVNFNAIRADRGWDPVQPIAVSWISCFEDETEAWEVARHYMGEQQDSGRRHYEFDDPEHFRETKGYETYAKRGEIYEKLSQDEINEAFAKEQVWGTPEQCLEQLKMIQTKTSAKEFILVFKYGSMPYELAERNIQLFADRVLPELQAFEARPFAEVAALD